jgi:hypothetical protein
VVFLAAALFTVAAPTPAHAVDLADVKCWWSDVAGGSGIVLSPAGSPGADSCSVRWGTPLTPGGKSGLGFDERSGLPVAVPLSTPFELGTLTHFNRPVGVGTAATGAKLNLDVTLDIPPLTTKPFAFTFTIDETLNVRPCTYTGASVCPDKITFSAPPASEFFSIGGVDYTLTLLGFDSHDGSSIESSVVTEEGTDTPLKLWARLTRRTPGVPTPSAFSLLGLGLVGIAMLRRRSK